MKEGGHGQTNQIHNINWDALNLASSASQLMSCNYYVCVHVCTTMIHEYLKFLCVLTIT